MTAGRWSIPVNREAKKLFRETVTYHVPYFLDCTPHTSKTSMKLVYVFTCLLTLFNAPVVVEAERMVRFMFNDGIPPTPNNECSESDFNYIDPLFNITNMVDRRRLQSSSSGKVASQSAVQHQDERVLRSYPAKCKDNCAGYAPGTCRASGCQGYPGRRLGLLGGLLGGDGKVSCDDEIEFINNEIDSLIANNALSLPCQNFMTKRKRKSQCYDDVIYGEIVSFTFFTATASHWSSHRNPPPPPSMTKLQENVTNGYRICTSTPFNIELVLNPCVNVVSFTLTSPNYYSPFTRTDSAHPMTLYESQAASTGYMRPSSPLGVQRWKVGSYTLKVIPDNFSRKEKTLNFEVIWC